MSTNPTTQSGRRPLVTTLGIMVALVCVAAFTLATPGEAGADGHLDLADNPNVVTANRSSGDISVIDTVTHEVTTLELSAAAEPMYVSHDSRNGLVLIGDRASSSILALDDDTFEIVGSVAVGDGVFHQWVDVSRSTMWVVGDTSGTVSVIDTASLELVETFAAAPDLVEAGAKPHDVFVSGKYAFVSFVGIEGGAIVAYDTRTMAETGRIVGAGGDPHLFVRAGRLHVASQDAGTVSQYKLSDLSLTNSAEVPFAHGIWVGEDNRVFATSIGLGGANAVTELDRNLSPVDTVDTDSSVPHNITVDEVGQLWVTHSGPNDQVSIVELTDDGFGGVTSVTVGDNPFGLAYVS